MPKNVTIWRLPLSEGQIMDFTVLNAIFAQISHSFNSEPMINLFPKLNDFLTSQQDTNASDSKIASYLGATTTNVGTLRQKIFDQYGGISFDDAVAQSAAVVDKLPHFNYVNFVPVAGVAIALTAILMGLRFFSRSRKISTENVLLHDWVMLVAWVLTVAWEITALAQARIPEIFKQSYDLTFPNFQMGQAFSFSLITSYPTLLLLIKSSILLFYSSLFPRHTSRSFYVLLHVTFVIALLSAIAQTFAFVFSCTPTLTWRDYLHAYCKYDWQLVSRYTTIINIINDAMILLIPVPIVWKLRMSIQERLLVTLTLGIGSASCIASVIRLYFLIDEQRLGTDHCFAMNLCSLVELNVAIICSCAPSLRLLIGKYWPKLLGTTPVKNKRMSRILALAQGGHRNSDSNSDKRSSMLPMGDRQMSGEKNVSTEAVV